MIGFGGFIVFMSINVGISIIIERGVCIWIFF